MLLEDPLWEDSKTAAAKCLTRVWRVHIRPSHSTWHILTHLDTSWHILTHLDTSWHTLTHLDTSWHILTHLDTSWHILTHLDTSWRILTHLDASWRILTHLDTSWHILTHLDTWYPLISQGAEVYAHRGGTISCGSQGRYCRSCCSVACSIHRIPIPWGGRCQTFRTQSTQI